MLKFIFLFLLSSSCLASEADFNIISTPIFPDSKTSLNSLVQGWSTQDKVLEGAFIVVALADWIQTRNISRHNCTNPETGSHDCYENGPAALFIGKNPSVGQVNMYFSTLIIAHVGITNLLDSKYRPFFQVPTIAIEFGYVYHNYQIGINADF